MIAMTPSLFRQLAVANLVTPFVGLGFDIARSPPSPDDGPLTPWVGVQLAIFLVLLVTFVASSIGLCFFARWSRPVALWFTAVSVIWSAFGDVQYTDPIARTLYDLSSALTGATLAAAYWSPVSRLFEPGNAEDDLREVFR
jgi:hypothetical protein